MVLKSILVLSFLLSFSTVILGQKISEEFCKEIDNSVVQPIKPLEFNRKKVYSNECVFEFTIEDGSHIKIRVEKHSSERESRQSIKSNRRLFTARDKLSNSARLPKKLDTEGYWNKVYFYPSYDNGSSFILLRKREFEIVIFAHNYEILVKLEKLLRNIKFED